MKKSLNILLIISNIISIAIIYPFILVFGLLKDFMGLADFESMPAEEVDKILNRTISSPEAAWPIFIFIALFLINSIIGIILIMKIKKYKVYAVSLFFFGGLGIANIFFLISYLTRSKKININIRVPKIVGASILATVPFFALIPLFMSISSSAVDKPTSVKEVVYSTNKKAPNLIEIFTDGFDYKAMEPLFSKDEGYKDFYSFPKFVTSGFLTNMSEPFINGGEEYTLWKYRSKHVGMSNNKAYADTYSKFFIPSLKKHMDYAGKNFSRNYFINPINLSISDNYTTQISGQPREIEKRINNLKVVNWAQTKNDNAGKFGVSNLSVGAQAYEWAGNHIKADSSANKGTRIYINDLMTHGPISTVKGGKYSLGPNEDFYKNTKNAITRYMDKLKAMKDKNGSVFDNSTIIIYGDHANHSRRTSKKDDKSGTEVLANRSYLMIKYAWDKNTLTNTMRDKSNRAIYAPYLNKIIDSAFNSKLGIKFLDDNSHFDLDPKKDFLTFIGYSPLAFYSHFVNSKVNGKVNYKLVVDDKVTVSGSAGITPGWFKYKEDKNFIENIFKKVRW